MSSNNTNITTEILASISKADNRLSGIEMLNVTALLECLFSKAPQEAVDHFSENKTVFRLRGDVLDDPATLEMIAQLGTAKRLELLRICHHIAVCDGELHSKEQAFLLKLASKLDLNADLEKLTKASS